MKKNLTPKRSQAGDSDTRSILAHYENQSDAEAAREITTAAQADESVWIKVPSKLLPQIQKIIDKRRSA